MSDCDAEVMRQWMERIWQKGGLIAWILSPLSGLYVLGWWAYQFLYRSGIKRAKKPHSPIVCVGNLTAGGSGKTPITIALAVELIERGHKVVLGLSGYGSIRAENASVAPEGNLDCRIWGDEPAMARLKLPDVPMIVGRNRVQAATLAAKNFPGHVLLMDDGYQHLPLETEIRILVHQSLRNRFCFPAGPYREPISTGTARSHRVIKIGKDLVGKISGFYNHQGERFSPPQRAVALCAIGSPHRFIGALAAMGIEISREVILTDHDPLQAGTLFDDLPVGVPVVVTEKDYVKLQNRSDIASQNILVADYSVEFTQDSDLVDWLDKALDGLHSQRNNR